MLAPVIADALEPAVDGAPAGAQPRWATVHALLLDAAARDQLGDPARRRGIDRARARARRAGRGRSCRSRSCPSESCSSAIPGTAPRHATLLVDDPRRARRIRAALRAREPTPLREELSEAELRVVRYLPSNLKAPEIAAELFVSANTVRTHLRHIYAKLDAHSRGEAVARARELGLLAPGGLAR